MTDRPETAADGSAYALSSAAELPAPVQAVEPAPGLGKLVLRVLPVMSVLAAVVLLTFVLEVTVLGSVHHARDQRVAYTELRSDFANALGPTGQLDVDGTPLALGRPIALLNIPAIGLREVVLEGTTAKVLKSGVGHRRDTVLPGQPGTSVIFGRQAAYGGPFGDITGLAPGARIEVVTGQSDQTIEYRVTQVRRSGETDEVSTDPQAGRLTLVTGSGTSFMPSNAVRVDAELVSKPLPTPGFAFGANALDGSEQAMAGDDSGALHLFLWSQLLLVAALAVAWLASTWGRRQSWLVGVPVLGAIGLQVASLTAQLLPNLL